jgi:hypothetical protein
LDGHLLFLKKIYENIKLSKNADDSKKRICLEKCITKGLKAVPCASQAD